MSPKLWIAGLLWFGAVTVGLAADRSSAVAVLDFSVTPGESNRWAWAEGGVSDLLQIELQQQGVLLLDRDGIHAVLAEQRLAASGRTVQDSLSLARLLNTQFLITGKVIPLAGERVRIEATVFSVETVETQVGAAAEGDFPKDLTRVVQQVAKQIATNLPIRSGFAGQTVQAVLVPKPEALIMFYRGLNACAAGQPEWGAAYFMNAASLDPDFTIPQLWETKAYELAGLPQLADLRRQEQFSLVGTNIVEVQSTNAPTEAPRPVLALLDPVISVQAQSLNAGSIVGSIKETLMTNNRVRLFAYEGIGAAVAEQDLQLSRLFARQVAPRYGRWLTADALLLCRIQPAESGQVEIELSLINPVNASVMAHLRQITLATGLTAEIPDLLGKLLATWTNRHGATLAPVLIAEPATHPENNGDMDLRPIYRDLVAAMRLVRNAPDKSDSHRALANAYAATGRSRMAAYEIEQCLKTLDIHAAGADKIFLNTHRWLFWEPSPASKAVGLVDESAITNLIGQLLAVYPQSLSAGCMRYNLAVSAWRGSNWLETIAQAQKSRGILQPLLASYNRNADVGINRGDLEGEIVAATYFLEGSSLRLSGQPELAGKVYHEGLNFAHTFKILNSSLPYGPYIENNFGPDRVYGYGGDWPGIQTRLEAELASMGETIAEPAQHQPAPLAVGATNAPGTDWIQKGQLELIKGGYLAALEYYQKAVAAGASVKDCPGLAAALLEIALDRSLEHPQAEVDKMRRELGFPPVQASWVELFAAGRKYQSGQKFDFEKAAACFHGALDFLEHPEQLDIYHLVKEPNSDRIILRWGPTLGECDYLWSQNYAARWNSAAFYLAQCLIYLDKKEEAAQGLRQIALKVGGDNALPLLEEDNWTHSSWSSGKQGIRAAELLQSLHLDEDRLEFGHHDGPFKLPATGVRARPVPALALPTIDAEALRALTNALVDVAHENDTRKTTLRLQSLVDQYGHALVPASLMMLTRDDVGWNEQSLAWILGKTAATTDAPWIVNACTRHWLLISCAERLDPAATATALAGVWQEYGGEKIVPPQFIFEIAHDRVRPLYALVLEQIAGKKVNHHIDVIYMDKAVSEEKSDELEAGFREALARCLKLKLLQQDNYELRRISQVALRHGVSEGIEGMLVVDAADLKSLRADLGSVLDLPVNDGEVMPYLSANRARWVWNPSQKKFTLPAQGKS